MGIPKWMLALGGLFFVMLIANACIIWLSSQGHRDLVRSDYYDAGLDQDKTIARTELGLTPGMDISFGIDSAGWQVASSSKILTTATCQIHFYRPDNGAEDKDLPMGLAAITSESPKRLVWKGAKVPLRQGYWVARLEWSENGKSLMEKSFRIHISG